jgi:tRNA-specific 2-thiouridylase
MKKVLLGMSGGVDSSVAAYLLREEGYDVTGVSFMLWEARVRRDMMTCCTIESIKGAAVTAEMLGIEHRVIDVRDSFMDKVILPFVSDYMRGSTPNPCVLCNLYIKFPFLLSEAESIGADFISTGHYACVERGDDRFYLKKGADTSKDQTYFLYVLNQDTLSRLVLPLCSKTKDKVRGIAGRLGLPASKRPESVEICFVGDEGYSNFIEGLYPETAHSGPIIGPDGSVLGTHRGIHNYTIGQRKGLGISYPEPLYVRKIDAVNNAIVVDVRERIFVREVLVGDINWLVPPDDFAPEVMRSNGVRGVAVTARIRSTMRDEPAVLTMIDGVRRARVIFDAPQWPPAPGQSAVFYSGEILLGGGTVKDAGPGC